MKNTFLLFILSLGLLTMSCKDSSSSNANRIQQSQPSATPLQTPPPSTSNVNPGVEHYICPNGHVGSGGAAAGTCSQCGATLEHNAAYHNNPSAPAGNNNQISPIIQQPGNNNVGTTLEVTPPPSVGGSEPPQNAAGVWHYTCSNGCEGGAGSAGTCSTCGGALAHNAAYHN